MDRYSTGVEKFFDGAKGLDEITPLGGSARVTCAIRYSMETGGDSQADPPAQRQGACDYPCRCREPIRTW
jgi:hypothetical protein